MGQEVGRGIVGYHVRFEKVVAQQAKITFLTDGMLLREAMLDNSLDNYGYDIESCCPFIFNNVS